MPTASEALESLSSLPQPFDADFKQSTERPSPQEVGSASHVPHDSTRRAAITPHNKQGTPLPCTLGSRSHSPSACVPMSSTRRENSPIAWPRGWRPNHQASHLTRLSIAIIDIASSTMPNNGGKGRAPHTTYLPPHPDQHSFHTALSTSPLLPPLSTDTPLGACATPATLSKTHFAIYTL